MDSKGGIFENKIRSNNEQKSHLGKSRAFKQEMKNVIIQQKGAEKENGCHVVYKSWVEGQALIRLACQVGEERVDFCWVWNILEVVYH